MCCAPPSNFYRSFNFLFLALIIFCYFLTESETVCIEQFLTFFFILSGTSLLFSHFSAFHLSCKSGKIILLKYFFCYSELKLEKLSNVLSWVYCCCYLHFFNIFLLLLLAFSSIFKPSVLHWATALRRSCYLLCVYVYCSH